MLQQIHTLRLSTEIRRRLSTEQDINKKLLSDVERLKDQLTTELDLRAQLRTSEEKDKHEKAVLRKKLDIAKLERDNIELDLYQLQKIEREKMEAVAEKTKLVDQLKEDIAEAKEETEKFKQLLAQLEEDIQGERSKYDKYIRATVNRDQNKNYTSTSTPLRQAMNFSNANNYSN